MSDQPQPTPLFPEGSTSPLSSVDADALDKLLMEKTQAIFNMSPTQYTNDDMKTVADYYRKNMARFLIEEQTKIAEGKQGGAKRGTKKATSVAEALKLNAMMEADI
jgi:hypothetical protein